MFGIGKLAREFAEAGDLDEIDGGYAVGETIEEIARSNFGAILSDNFRVLAVWTLTPGLSGESFRQVSPTELELLHESPTRFAAEGSGKYLACGVAEPLEIVAMATLRGGPYLRFGNIMKMAPTIIEKRAAEIPGKDRRTLIGRVVDAIKCP